MYIPFKIFSIVSVILTICFIIGLKFNVAVLNSDTFYSITSIYYIITLFTFLVLLFKDKKIIFVKNYSLKNILLYILTTPIPLILAFVLPYYLRNFKDNNGIQRDVADFNICENCVKEGDPIYVIYKSGGPAINKDFEFYYHYVGVSGTSGDTLNILTTSLVYISRSNNKKYYSSTMLKVIENLNSVDSNANIKDLQLRDINKVVIYVDDANNQNYMRYKTVIGELVTIIDTK